MLARSAIQIASVGEGVLERRLDPPVAARQTILLTPAASAARIATSVIAGIAILAMLQGRINARALT